VPSFSFITDTNTGMYLAGANILGLTANGSNILLLDGTTTGSEIVTTPGEFRALDGVKGGTF
jgi:hypothetical protein